MRVRKIICIVAACLLASLPALAQSNLNYEERSVTVVEPEAHVATTPIVADLSIIGDRITETVVLNDFRASRKNLINIQELKVFALSQLAQEYDADLIIATNVSVSTQNNHFAFTITGYPARYVNFRKPDKDDMDLIWRASRSGEDDSEPDLMDRPRIIRNH